MGAVIARTDAGATFRAVSGPPVPATHGAHGALVRIVGPGPDNRRRRSNFHDECEVGVLLRKEDTPCIGERLVTFLQVEAIGLNVAEMLVILDPSKPIQPP